MTTTQAFFLEETGRERLWLRRYVFSSLSKCPGSHGYHNAMVLLTEADIVWEPTTGGRVDRVIACRDKSELRPPDDDPRWPTKCDECDYLFKPDDPFQLHGAQLYRRSDNGEITTIREAPAGALWYADWMHRKGPDGHCLMAKVPGGGEWMIDGQASNCDKPNDKEHYCWVRHGEVPNITVDKRGNTCNAGAGSIQTHNWHGHLVNGVFRECV